MIDPIWAGVIGGAVGGGFTTLATLGAAHFERKGRLDELDKTRDNSDRLAQREYKQKLVAEWRIGLANAAKAQVEWNHMDEHNRAPTYEPDIVGQEWFESLRPHLDASTAAPSRLAFDDSITYTREDAVVLSDEIARIEREWGLI